ncbi:MAG: SUMF1/EgtB/PvdO family nonheme iron enzyme [Planctomycetota bacterium]|nr:SUMF1/EgtB/PvdO family nonheme iron enzyme [Planctomycetota bacterium]
MTKKRRIHSGRSPNGCGAIPGWLLYTIIVLAGFLLSSEMVAAEPAHSYRKSFEKRKKESLRNIAKRPLKQGPNPTTWVDVERWSVAHTCLAEGVRLEEANQYFSEVAWVSLWQGLVADTDVQVTDLLRTYLTFRKSRKLSERSKAHLQRMFGEWKVPNPDRNRNADTEYEWPSEYTENHSLNILVAAYLIDVVMERSRKYHQQLLEEFLGDRAKWGWSEFHSPRYAVVTAKALTCLSDFAPDKSVGEAAKMHLDILAYEFANQCLNHWRGVPFTRGQASQKNNRQNAFFELARLWFGDDAEGAKYTGGSFLVHIFDSRYVPPEGATWLVKNPDKRGSYLMTEVATTGPEKLRIPISIWVTPYGTMASAQGPGSYYDGCYWTISFATAPGKVITGTYRGGRNILQVGNVLATFGDVGWHGGLKKETSETISVGGDDRTIVGQVDLTDGCHLFMLENRGDNDEAAFRTALKKLEAKFEDGLLTWKMPDGRQIKMVNRRVGKRWQMMAALEDGHPIRLDRNMLFDSPHMRSVRGSKVIEILDRGRTLVYDFRNLRKPTAKRTRRKDFTRLPEARQVGPFGIELLYIPPGEFPMGSPLTKGRRNENPQRWVHVDGFYISQTEITIGQYRLFLRDNPKARQLDDWYTEKWGKTDKYPIAWISWQEAVSFCEWMSDKTRHTYRLPTEAEWEKAAKGLTERRYPWGNVYSGTQSGTANGTYAQVASKQTDKSPFGILDMAGNVWEWCSDWYETGYYKDGPLRNPTGPEEGFKKSLRGCGWNFDPDTFRCAYRSGLDPDKRSVHIGFRVVMEPEER